ncbi:MAG: peptidoglycan DD-metalloendopeptidase family protein [Actinomycetota bacterium]|nr:peptidoglycan DD-metalloendopeptidase family protein [Actinomycetota bacterium]
MFTRRAPEAEPRLDVDNERIRRAPAAGGRRKAPRRFSLVPAPAVLGAVALVIAGGGTVTMSAEGTVPPVTSADDSPWLGEGLDGVPVNASTRTDTLPISRSVTVSRQTLDRQTQEQAEQRRLALSQLAQQSDARADELLQRERAAQRREQARQDAREQAQAEQEALEQAQAEQEALGQEQAEQEALEQEQAEQEAANQWVLPLAGYVLSAGWGETSAYWSTYHTGIDFAAASGTPIVSIARGTVTFVGYDSAYGNKTEITLEDGTVIWYAHQTSQTVGLGQVVDPGELIGYVGATGNVTGPHLHLEVRVGGQDVDPMAAFAEHGVTP